MHRKLMINQASLALIAGLADDNSSYRDDVSGIEYISDAGFIDTGEIQTALNTYGWPLRYKSVRSFPQGRRNCYRIKVTSGTKYLIRASFLYGNYDGQNKIPEFQLHIGPNLWDTVRLVYDVSTPTRKELIHYVPVVQKYIHVCLVNTGSGVPFISVLELRPLPNSTYPEQKNNSLALVRRDDTGGNGFKRYPDDKLDRFWYDYKHTDWSQLNTSVEMIGSDYSSQPPSIVMKSAATPKSRTGSLDINVKDLFFEGNAKYHNYFHFAEVEKLPPNQSRLQYISKDGELFHDPFALSYLETTTIYWRWSLTPNTTLSISKVDNSTLPPILNALEIYLEKEFSVSETNQGDVDAITDIKSAYEIKRNWQGDPCNYILELVVKWINRGDTSFYFQSHNDTDYGFLNTLNLEKENNLSGSIPGGLIERRKHGLSLSLCENPNLSEQVFLQKEEAQYQYYSHSSRINLWNSHHLINGSSCFVGIQKERQHQMIKNSIPNWSVESMESDGQHFTYSELVKITNNFSSIIGSGGFGKVYHGTLKDGIQVAVKLLNSSSDSKEFQNEVKLLMRAHHRNLVSLIGNCYEGDTMALVFEYVSNGTLQQHISAAAENVLTWKERLQIAVDAARGLDYLHNGCKQPIVHRDLKTSNILLNEKMQAMICDSEFLKFFPQKVPLIHRQITSEEHADTLILNITPLEI
ncbi:hypothetical protein M0R45_031926 [Rubus argutus]|uniref:Protein kinase domain-containing protein n=1 Tax=Rubus argutus TaxID=59490 RepID=A0AAW1WF36_RUBAR